MGRCITGPTRALSSQIKSSCGQCASLDKGLLMPSAGPETRKWRMGREGGRILVKDGAVGPVSVSISLLSTCCFTLVALM